MPRVQFLTRLFLLCAMPTAILGCAEKTQYIALGPRYQTRELDNATSRIVVIWPSESIYGSGVTPRVLVNGKDIGKLEPMGYLDALVSPGETTVSVRFEAISDGSLSRSAENVAVAAAPGQEVFIEYAPKMGFAAADLTLAEIPVAIGRQKSTNVRKCVAPN